MDATADRTSRRKNDPAGMRLRILDAAFTLFQEQGYNATSIHQVAAAASVTGGALHHHFPTKKALGKAVIRELVAAAVDDVWLEPVRSAPSARIGILRVLNDLADQLDAQGSVRGCPINNLTIELAFADKEYRTELKVLFDRWRRVIADKLGGPNDALATTVVAAYSGAMAIAKVEQCGKPLRLCAEELKRLL